MRIVVVEDHALCREHFCLICGDYLRHEIVGEAADGAEAMTVIRQARPELVLCDIDLPLRNGLQVQAQLASELPQMRWVFISSHCSDRIALRIEQARVSGFIDKMLSRVEDFRQALEAVASGRSWFSPLYQEALRRRHADQASFDKRLTRRELEILELIARALSDAEIAARTGLAVDTAEKHRHNIMHKLGLSCTPKLMQRAQELGFGQLAGEAEPCTP